MATIIRVVDDRTQEQKQADWLHGLDDNRIACRGDHHDWPVLRPGRKLGRGIRAHRQVDGCYQVEVTCRNCGRVRVKTTLPGGVLDGSKWSYRDPRGWSAPKGLGLNRGDYVAELGRRMAETLTELWAAGDAAIDAELAELSGQA